MNGPRGLGDGLLDGPQGLGDGLLDPIGLSGTGHGALALGPRRYPGLRNADRELRTDAAFP